MTLANVPTTQLRICVSLVLAVVYVATLLSCIARGVTMNTELVGGLGLFILGLMTADVAQFTVKRRTYQPPAPASPSVPVHAADGAARTTGLL